MRHAPAIVLALVPQIAAWGKLQIDSALGAAGTSAPPPWASTSSTRPACSTTACEILGGGATLAGIILAAITVFIIERDFVKAAAFAVAGAVFTFFGLIHGEALGIGRTPSMVISYLGIAVILLACSKYAGLAPLPGEASRMHGHGDPAAKPAE